MMPLFVVPGPQRSKGPLCTESRAGFGSWGGVIFANIWHKYICFRSFEAPSQVAGGWGWGGPWTRSVNTWTGVCQKKREKNQHFPRIPVVSNMLPSQFNPHGGCLDKECVCDHN